MNFIQKMNQITIKFYELIHRVQDKFLKHTKIMDINHS